jgi:hypothetical protein
MNPVFIFVLGFGGLVLVFMIAIAILNKLYYSSSPPAWMRRLGALGKEMENAGWRIQMIPYEDPAHPAKRSWTGVSTWSGKAGIVPVLGPLGFIGGLALATFNADNKNHSIPKQTIWGLLLAVSSFAAIFATAWFKNRAESRDWDVAPARCVDRELRRVRSEAAPATNVIHSDRYSTWVWRILCEYEHQGRSYRVTPRISWSTFQSEAAAAEFLEVRISSDGTCRLRLDPNNPLKTELV